jgi:hypothetical protein
MPDNKMIRDLLSTGRVPLCVPTLGIIMMLGHEVCAFTAKPLSNEDIIKALRTRQRSKSPLLDL